MLAGQLKQSHNSPKKLGAEPRPIQSLNNLMDLNLSN